jgi:hypothetical protein
LSIEVSTSSDPSIVRPDDMSPYKRWKVEIDSAEKECEKFYRRAENVIRRFLDERDAIQSNKKWFNIFYANTNILESAIYAQMPKPVVQRKFIDYQDDVARVAATILERNVTPDIDDPRDTTDSVIRHCVQDRLIPGLAMAWCRLETDTEEEELDVPPEPGLGYAEPNITFNGFETGAPQGEPNPENAMQPPPGPGMAEQVPPPGGAPGGPVPMDEAPEPEKFLRITSQRVCVDYIYWKDFLWSPCRVWEERRWTGRRAYLDREELVKRFGEEVGNQVPLDFRPQGLSGSSLTMEPRNEAMEKACIYEIWDRMDRKVYWLSKAWPELLDEQEDFLHLVGFEPHPKPMLANISTSNTVPRPDYYMIQDQYTELDEVNNRISLLIKACKVVGVYAKNAVGVQRMLQEGFDNQLIPVDDWAMFAEKGGIKGQLDWLPLDQVITALQRLYEQREAIKGQIYELTGIADIVRGASKASETLGAQQIKAQFASVRIKKLQDEVARFVSEVLRIKAEIMVKHFDPEILIDKSNILHTDDAMLVGPAMQLLMSEEGFEWRISVSADTMGQTDYALEKQDRTELLNVISGYLQKNAMLLNDPKWAPLAVNLLKWTIAGFKGSDEIEGMIDRMLDQIMRTPPAPPPPSPEMIKAQVVQQQGQQKLAQGQQKMQQDQQSHQLDMQAKVMDHQLDQQDRAQEMENDRIMREREQQADAQDLAIDFQGKKMEQLFQVGSFKLDRAAEAAALAHELRTSNLKHATDLRKSSLEIRTAEAAAEAAGAKSRKNQAARNLRRPNRNVS